MGGRMESWQWVLAAAGGVAGVWAVAPHQVPVLLWVMTKVATGGVTGYWLDRLLFPTARPGDMTGDPRAADLARFRRAAIISAATIAAAIGY